MQYTHDYTFAIISKLPALDFQINNSKESIQSGVIGGKDYVGMSEDSSVSYKIGELKPGEEKEIDIIIAVNENHDSNLVEKIQNLRKTDVKKELDDTKKYWRKFVKDHTKIDIEETKNEYFRRISKIYKRSILLFPILMNYNTGGISASVEVDESMTKCGRYSYCWPRDAVFITEALDKIGMESQVQKFYQIFCKNTQNKNGMWEQRYYTDGNLAPCWGYQIDETAAIVFGVYKHYLHTKNEKFIKDNLKMCKKATHFLEKYIEDVINDKDIQKSYDIWEENEGIHTYSLASIFGSFNAMLEMYKIRKENIPNDANRIELEQIKEDEKRLEKYMLKIKEYILNNFYDNSKNSFIRNKDGKMDISLVGLVYPFNILKPKEKKMENTIQRIDMTLRTYTGGYLRYENDNYCGGNPWIISNLWMANYYLDRKEKKKAEECFRFAVKSATEHGFLPEQVDNSTMQAKWVIGLRVVSCNVYYYVGKIDEKIEKNKR